MNLLILFLAIEIFSGIVTFNFYKQAGRQSWEAFVPIYRTVVMLKIIERPWWWIILCYLPVVGNVMAVVVIFEMLHVFNFRKLYHTILAVITFGLYLGYLNFTQKLEYVGRDIQDMRRYVSELVASLIFAIVAATVIRAYTFEAFTIPTPSMEKSLMVGDFLFVSKIHYGSRPPLTPLSLPLVHNKVPFTTLDSYFDWPQLPYWRFPKLTEVERYDPVVFNYPAEDIRPINMEGKVRPIDKREHYVKRCVAIPGDTLRIIDGFVNTNGESESMPDRANPQFSYFVQTNGVDFNPKILKERFDINYVTPRQQQATGEYGAVTRIDNNNLYIINIPNEALEGFKQLPNIVSVTQIVGKQNMDEYPADTPPMLTRLYQQYNTFGPNQDIFPNPKNGDSLVYNWSRDNYGPLYMPKEGDKIELNNDTYLKYSRAITAYEGNTLERKGDQFILNGEVATEYTFKQGYYWMMGDNRHASDDSRYWGFVPEDHIVGKPVFIWMSYDKFAEGIKKIRFDRVFTTVNGEGKRFSYFIPFLIVVAGIYGFNTYRKRKKAKA
ncbi:signal peptidase I [Owenweeksia hongkongensis]|uniref:signal peptidase I n=1 Tax=Owenweeksia hongkongensis TaxID=253245 RepID=UPI003A94E161